MQRITIELLTEDALQKVQQLEEQNILRVITPDDLPKKKTKRNWVGGISKETAQRMLKSVARSREEWR